MLVDAAPFFRLYVSRFCAECERAVALLVRHELRFELVDVGDPAHCCHLDELQGRPAVPQAFVGDRVLSGYRELAAYVGAVTDAPAPQSATIPAVTTRRTGC